MTCATACATRWRARASFSASAVCRRASKKRRRLVARDALRRRRRRGRPGAHRDRPLARHQGTRPRGRRGQLTAAHGAVKVDDNLTSNVPSIHAIGDATHRVNLTPVAIREGHMLADRLFGPGAPPIRYDTIASAVFGTPEIGTVGLTEKEALERFPKRRRLQDRLPAAEGDGLGGARPRDHEAYRRRRDAANRRRASPRA